LEEAVAEVFGHGAEGIGGHGVEVAFGIEEAIRCEDVAQPPSTPLATTSFSTPT
jgi:hypothetical protein